MSGNNPPDKLKVAIVGGGCGALTAAYMLTQESHKFPCEVTIYQMGWRLGGKGASGRNKAIHNRTEEHGLHVWMGFYENAFWLMRDCYAKLPKAQRQSLFASWEEAFIPDHWVGVAEESRGAWRLWTSFFPATPGMPGDPLDPETNPFTLRNYLARSLDLLRALIHSSFTGTAENPSNTDAADFSSVTPRAIVDKLSSVIRSGVLTGAGALYEAMAVLQVVVSGRFSLPDGDYLVLKYAEAIAANLKQQAEQLFASDEQLRPKLELVELVVTVVVGILRDQLLSDPDGLDAINDEDCRVWLRRHGASERATESALVRALYDMAFADEKVDAHDTPGLAAGQALRGALRMFFTYRGSLFWKMRAGMGDVVFSPLYEVLKHRGVKFKFFHELVDIELKDERVTGLLFNEQATLNSRWQKARLQAANLPSLEDRALKDGEYYPLDEDGCWPSAPQLDQLRNADATRDYELPCGAEGRKTPTAVTSRDFDCVVLGVSLGALASACPSLLENRRFRAMHKKVKTIPTQAMQLWFNTGLDAISPASQPITVAGFEDPFDTWSDMTHIIAQEKWPEQTTPQGLAYFCGALPHGQSKAEQADHDSAKQAAIDYLDHSLPQLWQQTRVGRRDFDWDLLQPWPRAPGADPTLLDNAQKLALLETHYFARNIKPSDRYVLTRPGSTLYRISPLDTGFENMTIAGDWTECGFNEGCVEAAVMSGMLASHAVSCLPHLDDIIGYDHP